MKLKPSAGCAVRDPVKGILLPAEGDEVGDSLFWRRRLRDGDVEIVTDAAKKVTSTADAGETK